MDAKDVTPGIHLKNEEYWIHYVLRDLFKVFDQVYMLDTGSTDRTVKWAERTAREMGGELILTVEDMHNDPHLIGQCSTRLRQMIETPWMLLVDGDEVWREEQLHAMLEQFTPDPMCQVGMILGRVLDTLSDGTVVERTEGGVYDRLFSPEVRWDLNTEYPFQSHGLEQRLAAGRVEYLEHATVFFWHVRHLYRSSADQGAYFRDEKRGYYPWDGESYHEMPPDWLGTIRREFVNPHMLNECATLQLRS